MDKNKMSVRLEVKSFEKLYGVSKDGKIKNWEIYVERFEDYSEIVTLHGYDNKIETRIRVNKGKNIGKKNETTHFEQAILEAQSKWKKKHDVEKYTNTIENTPPKSSIRLPMLAQDYLKHKNKLNFPCFIQPKLDGYRMIYDSSLKTITTRQGKTFEIVKESKLLYEELSSIPKGYILDGELYVHSDDVTFETLGVLRKTKKLTDEDRINLNKIEYHVYDLIDVNMEFQKRTEIVEKLISGLKKIRVVPTIQVSSEKEILERHEGFVKDGYEGSMLRNSKSKYLEKNRSYDLLKFKDFMDEEFEIIGYTFEKDTSGEDKNCVVWIVKVKDGVECKVRPMGSKEKRQEILEECERDFSKFKGRKLWTKFFEYTSDGSLRFPTTKTGDMNTYIRDEIL